MAMGLGADVTVLDSNLNRLRYLSDIFSARVQTLASNVYNIADAVREADLVIGSVLIPGAMAPKLVTEAMIKTMRKGSVVVDVAIDQGGSFETTAASPPPTTSPPLRSTASSTTPWPIFPARCPSPPPTP